MLCASHVMLREALPFFKEEPPVLCEWLPWAHTFASNSSFGLILYNGGTYYLDQGRPTPQGMAETVRNLREVAPTIFFNVPKGFEELLPHLQRDETLRKTFFSRVKMFFYAGAGLSEPVFQAYRELSAEVLGAPLPWTTSLGSTETGPGAIINVRGLTQTQNVGVPHRGVELKLVPNAGKMELRLRGPNITPGYWRRPDLNQAAFDEEGFYKIGDALKLAVPGDWSAGFMFDGRVSEDFKLATGTWVSVGPLRLTLLNRMEPLAQDAVIAGEGRDEVGALVFPNFAALAAIAPDLTPHDAVRDPPCPRRLRRETHRLGRGRDWLLDAHHSPRALDRAARHRPGRDHRQGLAQPTPAARQPQSRHRGAVCAGAATQPRSLVRSMSPQPGA